MGFATAIQTASGRLGIMRDLFAFFWSNKRWWLVPMLIILFVVGILIILAQSSAIAPFIYPLF
jgi:Family of unknown function (DUF5989)